MPAHITRDRRNPFLGIPPVFYNVSTFLPLLSWLILHHTGKVHRCRAKDCHSVLVHFFEAFRIWRSGISIYSNTNGGNPPLQFNGPKVRMKVPHGSVMPVFCVQRHPFRVYCELTLQLAKASISSLSTRISTCGLPGPRPEFPESHPGSPDFRPAPPEAPPAALPLSPLGPFALSSPRAFSRMNP